VTVASHWNLARDDAGRPVAITEIDHDISEQKRGDATRDYLAAIIESSDDGIIGKGLDGIVRSWNKGAQAIFGYAAEDMLGRAITVLIPPERPERRG